MNTTMYQPKLAIIDPNILSGMGLQNILEEIVPVAEVTLIDRFEDHVYFSNTTISSVRIILGASFL